MHAVRHMIEEGFDEDNLIEAMERGEILEDYPNEKRCLILGYFYLTQKTKLPLHVVYDYSENGLIDFVTAHIPQKPWWETPAKRGKL